VDGQLLRSGAVYANNFNMHSIWKDVTENIIAKDFNQATKIKHSIEEAQRLKAAERKSKGEEFVPRLFKLPVEGGKPELTDQAIEVLKSL
jgi:hypothetical protein